MINPENVNYFCAYQYSITGQFNKLLTSFCFNFIKSIYKRSSCNINIVLVTFCFNILFPKNM